MAKKRKAKMGRPPKKAADRRSVFVGVWMTPGEAARVQAEADRRGIAKSDLLMRDFRRKEE